MVMRKIPDYADLMTLEEWNKNKGLVFIPTDGIGFFATETEEDDNTNCFDKAPAWATHVAWYNK